MAAIIETYYNSGTATKTDGHHRSRVYLRNNKFSFPNSSPFSYNSYKTDGIVHSGFLLSELSEIDMESLGENTVYTGNEVCPNIPVKSYDNDIWGSFSDASSSIGNHRFLSNRTLENKYPYFQNIELDGEKINGITIINTGSNMPVEYITDELADPFVKYDADAKVLVIEDVYCVVDDSSNAEGTPHIVTISLDNDEIECRKGDVLTAALVTDMVTSNSVINTSGGGYEEKQSRMSHHIKFVELDSNGSPIATYDYEVPYRVGEVADMYQFRDTYPCTSACRHVINNNSTKKVKIVIEYYRSVIITDFEMSTSYSQLYAILVEKNK